MKQWLARRYRGDLQYIIKVKPVNPVGKSTGYFVLDTMINFTDHKHSYGGEGEALSEMFYTNRELVEFIFSEKSYG